MYGCFLDPSRGLTKQHQPILYPEAPLPPPIIPGVEKSRPPIISPKLKALLTSPHSRTTKPLDKSYIVTPRNMPARADPTSEEARIYGPFSKRREVNIRRRFFKMETKKILPPHEITADGLMASEGEGHSRTVQQADKSHAIYRDLDSIVGPIFRGPTKTRREREADPTSDRLEQLPSDRHPSRWVRRRYRNLLSRIPQLVSRQTKESTSFSVQPSPLSFAPHQSTATHMPEADPVTLAWLDKPFIPINQKTSHRHAKK